MNISRIYAIFLRQFYLARDNPTRLFQIFMWIILDIIEWGFISKYLSNIVGSGFGLVSALLGAAILAGFLSRVMQGVTTSFFEDIWSHNFLNLFASPISVLEYITGLVLTSISTSALGLIVMLLLATTIFGFSVFVYGISLITFLTILFLFGIALGIIGVSIVLKLGPSGEWFVWPIPALLSPFMGVFYPLSTLPQWMQFVGHLLPPSYVFENVRAIVAGKGFSSIDLTAGIILSLVYIVLAYGIFWIVYRKAIRTGLIARYSAESVGD